MRPAILVPILALVSSSLTIPAAAAPGPGTGLPGLPITSVLPADDMDGVVLAPDQPFSLVATTQTIIVHNEDDVPIPNATVEIRLTAQNPLCDSADPIGVTDADGIVEITVSGGGCVHDTPLGVTVRVNGVIIRDYQNGKSPDYDGRGADGRVDVRDLVAFAGEFLGGGGGCHDYDNDGHTGLEDLLIFAPAFLGSNHCELR